MWNTLIRTTQRENTNSLPSHLNIIFNPARGPGVTTDPNYYNPNNPSIGHRSCIYAIWRRPYHYLWRCGDGYGDKPLNDVKNEIDAYQTLYPNLVDGIFLDEMSNQQSKVAIHQTIYAYIKTDTPPSSYKGGTVIGNPGTQTIEAYLLPATRAADTLVNFENTGNEYLTNYNAPPWVTNYTPDHFAHLIHTQGAPWSNNFLTLAEQRNAGMIYVTDDAMPNPWDALASYWANEVSDIKAHNSVIIPPFINASIDIKPGGFPNSINPRSNGKIPVAILTTNTFNATTVDPATVLFGKTGSEAASLHFAFEDVDGDGDLDMVLHFSTQATRIQCGDVAASLTAKTFSNQLIQGADSIKTAGCK